MTDTSPDDEQVLLVVHKHWASLLGEAALTIVPGLTILSLLLLLRGLPITLADATVHAVITLLVPFCFLTLWTILAVQWTNYYLEMFVVTDRHIFYTTQVNFTERTVSQWNIHDVSHATVHVGGLIESFPTPNTSRLLFSNRTTVTASSRKPRASSASSCISSATRSKATSPKAKPRSHL